ncbi:MAG: TadE/TadG family type IV pilus assembly protein, partial [Actinomycetota bacterium]
TADLARRPARAITRSPASGPRQAAARTRRRRWPGPSDARGQATVELALALPVVLLALLAVVQVGVVVHHRLLVANAAREGARAAAVDPTPEAARSGAVGAGGLDPARLEVHLGPSAALSTGDRVTVAVRYRSPTDVPLVGALLPDVTFSSAVTMRVE